MPCKRIHLPCKLSIFLCWGGVTPSHLPVFLPLGMVFVDLKKAFDTVYHQILCRKLESYGILHRELAWFGSYLSNRVQYCRVNGVDSQIENIDIGMPQGSCLGPLLFIVYINYLPRAVKNSTISMYADETSLCFKSKDLSRLNDALNVDLSRLDAWLISNCPLKCQYHLYFYWLVIGELMRWKRICK